jgi:DNA-binding transcriptional regulator YiaG
LLTVINGAPMSPDEARQAIAELGVNHTEYAALIGVSPFTIRRWVSPRRRTAIPKRAAVELRLMLALAAQLSRHHTTTPPERTTPSCPETPS